MKFTVLVAALLFGSAYTQNGYVAGGSGSAILPTNIGGSDNGSGSGSGSGTISVTIPSFPKADILKVTTASSTNFDTTNQNIANTINGAKNQLSTPVRSVQSLFSRFPSKSQLTKFADDGDTAAILKTLQVVASDDSVPCGTKISYLLELLGSVKSAIQRKNLYADQLVSIIDGAKAQIARLQDEITRVQKDRDALGIPDIQKRVNDIVAKLNNLYNQINAVKAQIPPEQARVAGYEKQINTYTKQNDDQRNRISNDKLKLTTTINLIKDLEAKLQDAKDTKAALEASISNSEGVIRENNTKISNIRTTIAEINAKIKSLQDTADRLKRDANTLEVDLERNRTDLSVAQVKDNKLANDIKDLKDRIANQQPKLVDDDLKKLRTLIDNLNTSLPTIQNSIDRQYYYCYGAGKVETITTGNTIVYVIKGQAFGQYVESAYGQGVWAPSLRTNGDYRLQVVDPFSAIWTAKFGYPQVSGGSGSRGGNGGSWNGSGSSGSGSGRGDFSCISRGGSSSGRGVISSVNNDGIVINDSNGKPVTLRIGSCSRLQSTSSLPKAGQNMVWKGAASSNGGYDLLSGTCF